MSDLTILDILPYIVTIVTCYITIKVCLTRHDLQIQQIQQTIKDLTAEVKANNDVKLRVTKLESDVEWMRKFINEKGE